MRDRTASRRLAGLALPALMACHGCFSYANVPVASLAGPGPIRIYLNPPGSAELASLIGARARWIDGDLIGKDSLALTVSVREVGIRDGSPSLWAGERVSVPRSAIDSAGARHLNGSQTTVAAVGVSTGLLLLRAAFAGIKQSIGGGGGAPPPGSR